MEIPKNVKTHEMRSSILWFEDDILFSAPKPGIPPDLDRKEVNEEMEKIRELIGHKKVCIVSEANPNSKPPSKEDRDYVAGIINEITKAMAIVTTSPVARMIANLFFGLKPPPYPTKMFTNKEEAVEWIKQFK